MDDVANKTYLVTGANTGIGRAAALELARRGGRVYLGCRSEASGRAAAAYITQATRNTSVEFLRLDLANLESVSQCAEMFLARDIPLHGLVNNAGVAGQRGLTRQGFELTFGVNHLGHFLLTTLLLDRLAASAPARVVTVASDAHYRATGIDEAALRRPGRTITGLREYSVSKLCNVVFSQELARRVADRGVTTYAVHPGVVASDIWRRVPWPIRPLITSRMLSTQEGAATTVYCATSPDVAKASGLFYDACQEREPSSVATAELGRWLWELSETQTAPFARSPV
jgi:retinol dehydrogenase 12